MKKSILLLFFLSFCQSLITAAASDPEISISTDAFCPSVGQSVNLTFRFASSGKATAEIVDLNNRVIRTLANEPVKAGFLKYDWDGRDQNGMIVKNGCYLPRIRFESATDRVSFRSSTQELKDVEVKPDYYDRLTGVLSYRLPQSSLVTVKAEVVQHNKTTGEIKHVVKKVIAKNAARTAGKVVEYFDGYSDDGVYLPNANYTITIVTKPLPPNTVIVYGGEDPDAGGSQ